VRIPAVRTVLTEEQIIDALRQAYAVVFGHAIGISCLAVAWAHICHESNRGKALWCNNFGNVTTKRLPEVPYYDLTAREVIDGKDEMRTLAYRAHPDPVTGAEAYWMLLRDRYATALRRFELGDPVAAAHALKDSGYFTDHVDVVARSLSLLNSEFMRRFGASAKTDPAMPAVIPDELTPVVIDRGAVEAATDTSLRSLTAEQIREGFYGPRGGGEDGNA
jgi:hypothetical protein